MSGLILYERLCALADELQTVLAKCAQHSVHPISGKVRRSHGGGSLRVFDQFTWLGVGSDKAALSRPAHQRVTHTVRRVAAKVFSMK